MTKETAGRMVRRVAEELMAFKNILVINDEAHHCYRINAANDESSGLKGDERREAEKENKAARVWIDGIEALKHKLGVRAVYDLSATPFFLSGSGWPEGTLFPWTVSDFSLIDAIECGIIKLPRVPVADNIPGEDVPVFRNLWDHIGQEMPKKGRLELLRDCDEPGNPLAAPQCHFIIFRVLFILMDPFDRDNFAPWGGVRRPWFNLGRCRASHKPRGDKTDNAATAQKHPACGGR